MAPLETTDAAGVEAAGETRRALRLEVVRTFAAGLAGACGAAACAKGSPLPKAE